MKLWRVLITAGSLWASFSSDVVDSEPVRVGLSVDMRSFKDFLVLVHSLVLVALKPEGLHLHVMACGRTPEETKRMRDLVLELTPKCVPQLRHLEVVPFSLPSQGGFARQLTTVVQKSHWYSPTGADTARFFLADHFPHTRRMLYLDNDIVVTCCLEEIFYTKLRPGSVAGIVLDDLKWATSTQFHRHYNRTHPLVIKNVRRKDSSLPFAPSLGTEDAITEDEFMKKLPKYPNDGVLLIDTQLWRSKEILPLVDELAAANGRGESAISLGTQQFTVLALHDRWTELTPRANLRHFPDMARGFLMWYLYTGVVHFAGQSKPQHVCDANSALDHRISTYHPWVLNVHYLSVTCPLHVVPNNTRRCGDMHIPKAESYSSFLDLAGRVFANSRDSGLLYLRIGGLVGWGRQQRKLDPLAAFDRHVLMNSSWSWRLFDASGAEGVFAAAVSSGQAKGNGKDARTFVFHQGSVCDGTDPLDRNGRVSPRLTSSSSSVSSSSFPILYPYVDQGGNIDPASPLRLPCLSVLAAIKEEKKKKAHWDVMAVAIDVLPTLTRPLASSLGTLSSLPFEFIRPKLVLVRVGRHAEVAAAVRLLQRFGFVATSVHNNVVFAHRVNVLELDNK